MYLNDDNVEELNSELELSCIRNLLLEIIKNNHEDMIYDINFIVLDKALDFKSYRKIFVELLVGYQKEFISKGTIPSIEDIHEKLIKIISKIAISSCTLFVLPAKISELDLKYMSRLGLAYSF